MFIIGTNSNSEFYEFNWKSCFLHQHEIMLFNLCISLKLISISSSITSIEDNLFYGSFSAKQIQILSFVISFSNWTFSDYTSSVKSIKNYAFYGCSSIIQIYIFSSLTSIRKYFGKCSNTKISIPSSVIIFSKNVYY